MRKERTEVDPLEVCIDTDAGESCLTQAETGA